MDAVKEVKNEKQFTVINITQVQWAVVGETSLTMKVASVDTPITVDETDGLFSFYRGIYLDHKEGMLNPPEETKPTLV